MLNGSRGGSTGRRIGLGVLGACTLWLVVQNTMLLVTMLWASQPPALVAASAVIKAGWHVLGTLWMIPVTVAVSCALLAWLITEHARGVRAEV